jgi:cytochrome c-type biogenesis protein CcmH
MPEAAIRRRLAGSATALFVAFVLTLIALPAATKEAVPEAADPALEARMTRITSELRCLVCQNQTIADSTADLAADLRRETRELLKQGKSDQEIVDYMTARYGDFVLYRPPLRATTVLLWFGPALMLVTGAAVLVLVLRRRSRMASDAFEADDEDDEDDRAVAAGGAAAAGSAAAT